MRLTEKEQAMLNGEMGPGFARAMRVLVGIGKAFGAERMVPISRGHISLSNQEGDLWFVSKLLEEQAHCMVPPTVNPAYDYEYFKTISKLDEENERTLKSTIDVYRKLGAILTFDCTPFFENNVPRFGEICSFSASGGAVYVNSVLGPGQIVRLLRALCVRPLPVSHPNTDCCWSIIGQAMSLFR